MQNGNKHASRLEGRSVLITGGTSGIGLATARQAVAEGARVMITGSSERTVAEALSSFGDGVDGVVADVRDLAALDTMAEEAKSRLGQVDVLFANAGLGVFGPIEAVSEEDYDKQFDINVKGVFFTVQKILPLMAEGGSIILTSSAVNEKGVGTGSIYFGSKAAVRSFARVLAAELGPKGIRVNALSPGVVRTHFADKVNIPQDAFEGFMQMVTSQAPLAREGKADEMAKAAIFLASDDSAYMTAADMVVDGGWMNV